MRNRKLLGAGLAGSALFALGCFTPALVALLGLAGMSAIVGGLDYVLFPGLFASLGLVAFALYQRSGRKGPSPKAVIALAVAALSALLFWLEFKYAVRISVAAGVVVAAYATYLRAARRAEPIDEKEAIS